MIRGASTLRSLLSNSNVGVSAREIDGCRVANAREAPMPAASRIHDRKLCRKLRESECRRKRAPPHVRSQAGRVAPEPCAYAYVALRISILAERWGAEAHRTRAQWRTL